MLNRREFGRTGLQVSERGFGAWAIGGRAFGAVAPESALAALARAEELGCNFVDTAAVYGDSEALLGSFLKGRRDRWILATKYSGQPEGMTALVEQQLRRLGTECIDFHQIHWAPAASETHLYEELEALKRSGKIRFAGVSLKTAGDMRRVLDHAVIDGLQLPVSLLDPQPLIGALPLLRARRPALVARSALRGGFLAGHHDSHTRFSDPDDQRSQWDGARIEELARQAAAFDFLRARAGGLREAALAYPLCFPEVSTLVISCKSASQVDENLVSRPALDAGTLARIGQVQQGIGIGRRGFARRALDRVRSLLGRGR
jgi:aryl-alcohol dehydrogenase-like predicted oxidoreductase